MPLPPAAIQRWSIAGILVVTTVGFVAYQFIPHPTSDPTAVTHVYIPIDLEDALRELGQLLPLHTRLQMQFSSEESMIRYHHGLGTWIRNNWGLRSKSRLSTYFNQLGIYHADDMSGIILDAFWYKLHNKPFPLQNRIDGYQEYWRSRREPVGNSPKDGARIVWVIIKGLGKETVHLGISVSDKSYWRYEYLSSRGIEPARPEDIQELDELVEDWKRLGTTLEEFIDKSH